VVRSGQPEEIEQYARLWVASRGQRTVGQRQGLLARRGDGATLCVVNAADDAADGGGSGRAPAIGVSAANVTERVCYGWQAHDKPLVGYGPYGAMLASGLTAIVHLNMGEVSRVVWDDGCSLCSTGADSADALVCLPDNTSSVCSSGGAPAACTDCYLRLSGCDAAGTAADPAAADPAAVRACAPTVHLAWIGTDARGRPMRSGGKVFSRFRAYNLQATVSDAYGAVSAAVTDTIDSVTGTIGSITDTVTDTVDQITGGTAQPPPPGAPPVQEQPERRLADRAD